MTIKGGRTVYVHELEYFAILPVRYFDGWIWLKWVRDCLISYNGVNFKLISREVINDAI